MCGLFGSVGNQLPTTVNQTILDHLRSRGPSSYGSAHHPFSSDRIITLLHSRLAIQDLTSFSNQPFYSPEFQLSLVFNGEIYNLKELQLRVSKYVGPKEFRSDTELILYCFHFLGVNCFSFFSGIFALAIFDHRANQLILARDRHGVKPLFYSNLFNAFLFGSTTRSLLLSRQLFNQFSSFDWFKSYQLWGSLDSPLTIHPSIQEFPPGCVGIYSSDFSIRPFSPPLSALAATRSTPLESIFERVVEQQLVGVSSPCVFLSGGLDSSLLAYFLASFSSDRTTSVTLGFPSTCGIDETESAKSFASSLGLDHHVYPITSNELDLQFDSYLACLDQPSIDGFNTFLVSSESTKLGFKVAYSGLGADELFYGYPHMSFHSSAKYVRTRCLRYHGLTRADLFSLVQPRIDFAKSTNHSTSEMNFYLRNTLLRDSDSFSQSLGLELRVPFLDDLFVNFAYRHCHHDHVANGPKSLLHQLSSKIQLPLNSSVKKGFNLPIGTWLLSSPRFSPRRIQSILHSFDIPKRSIWLSFIEMKASPSRYAAYWRWVVLAEWLVANS